MTRVARGFHRWVVRAEAGPYDEVQAYPYPSMTLLQYQHADRRGRRDSLVAAAVLGAVEVLLTLVTGYAALFYLDVGPVGRVVALAVSGVFLTGALSSQASLRVMWRHRDDDRSGRPPARPGQARRSA